MTFIYTQRDARDRDYLKSCREGLTILGAGALLFRAP